MRLPRLYLGTMTFAWNQASVPVDDKIAQAFLQRFIAAGGRHVDTARIYAGGETEPMLGRALKATPGAETFIVGSKAAPSQPGGLSATGMRAQLAASLDAIEVDALAEYYLHQVCRSIPTLDLWRPLPSLLLLTPMRNTCACSQTRRRRCSRACEKRTTWL